MPQIQLQADAALNAIADAGLKPSDIDGAGTLRVRPTPERPLSPRVISTVSQRPEANAAAAWQTWIMNEQAPTAVP